MPYTLQIPVIVVLIVILFNMGLFNYDLFPHVNGQQYVQIQPNPQLQLQILDTIAPSSPTLFSPPNNSISSQSIPSFDWNDVSDPSGVSYIIQISSDVKFSSILYVGSTINSDLTKPFFKDGIPYYWRVFAVDGAGNTSTSSTSAFTIDTTPPPVPTLLSLSNGVTTTDATPFFKWTPVSDLISNVSYTFQISKDSSFTKSSLVYATSIYPTTPVDTFALAQTTFAPSTIQLPQSLPDGTYYWRVFAVDSIGNQSKSSSYFSFTIDTTPPPVPTLLSLSNGVATTDATPSFDWTDVNDVSSVAYQIEISTDPKFQRSFVDSANSLSKSSYVTATTLPDGTYYWRVFAIDGAGNTSLPSSVFRYTVDTVIQPNIPPVAIISSFGDFKINTDIHFSGTESYDPDGDIVRQVWTVDGKNDSNDPSLITKNFQSGGSHEIILTVYDNHDASDKTTLDVIIDGGSETSWIPLVVAIVAIGGVGAAVAITKFTGKKIINPKANVTNFEVEVRVGLE